ncbi:MAG: hypothetical protein D6796_00545 [Caldilineae bacterium]|nr:MAG: hypothetical protein D6796_00545 [Caldilineae bacterium]
MADNTTPSRQRVLIADKIADVGVEMLRAEFDVTVQTGLSEEALCALIGDYHALVVRSATKVTAKVMEAATSLKVIARAGAGLDNIDIAAARARGIEVVNAPDANTHAVAEHTMGLMLALARRLPEADRSLKKGEWKKSALVGTGLYDKTLGIIGFGRIGREVARRAQAFGMHILVNQRRRTPELELESDVRAVDLHDLLRLSDFVTLHVPLKPDTVGLIGRAELAMMKPNAYLINTARGKIVDETALLEALNAGQIAGAAVDVFTQEPALNSDLARHPRVIATPHIAASTADAQRAAAVTVARQILDILTAQPEENPLSLYLLPLERVIPHEQTDPSRVERLVSRLQTESVLKNPPIVTEWEGRYVVLDGATRVTALKAMGYRYIAAQVIPRDAEELDVRTWNHVLQHIEPERLLELIEDLPEVKSTPVEAAYVQDSMLELGGLCHLTFADGRTFIIQPAAPGSRLDAMNRLVEAYIAAADVARTMSDTFDAASREYPDIVALVVFPVFSVEQILQISSLGKVMPAGITRFVIPGRVLRLNLDLTRLAADEPITRKRAWFHQFLRDLMARHKIRYYQEPVYLLDE